MSINGSAVRRASALRPHGPDADSGRAMRDRRRLGAPARARRSAHRDLRGTTVSRAGAPEEAHEARDEIAEAFEDGLDPAFDELGDLYDHVDGLSRWMRLGRAFPGHHDG